MSFLKAQLLRNLLKRIPGTAHLLRQTGTPATIKQPATCRMGEANERNTESDSSICTWSSQTCFDLSSVWSSDSPQSCPSNVPDRGSGDRRETNTPTRLCDLDQWMGEAQMFYDERMDSAQRKQRNRSGSGIDNFFSQSDAIRESATTLSNQIMNGANMNSPYSACTSIENSPLAYSPLSHSLYLESPNPSIPSEHINDNTNSNTISELQSSFPPLSRCEHIVPYYTSAFEMTPPLPHPSELAESNTNNYSMCYAECEQRPLFRSGPEKSNVNCSFIQNIGSPRLQPSLNEYHGTNTRLKTGTCFENAQSPSEPTKSINALGDTLNELRNMNVSDNQVFLSKLSDTCIVPRNNPAEMSSYLPHVTSANNTLPYQLCTDQRNDTSTSDLPSQNTLYCGQNHSVDSNSSQQVYFHTDFIKSPEANTADPPTPEVTLTTKVKSEGGNASTCQMSKPLGVDSDVCPPDLFYSSTGVFDEKLHDAAVEYSKSGKATSLLKEELKMKIQNRRLTEGKDELVVDFNVASKPEPLTVEEELRKSKRKESNKKAARKSRIKRQNTMKAIEQEEQDLERKNRQLKQEVTRIEKLVTLERDKLLAVGRDKLLAVGIVIPPMDQYPFVLPHSSMSP